MAAEEEPSKWSRLKVISAMGMYVHVCLVTWNSVITMVWMNHSFCVSRWHTCSHIHCAVCVEAEGTVAHQDVVQHSATRWQHCYGISALFALRLWHTVFWWAYGCLLYNFVLVKGFCDRKLCESQRKLLLFYVFLYYLVSPWSLFIAVGRDVTGSVICLMFNLRRHICFNLLVVVSHDAVCWMDTNGWRNCVPPHLRSEEGVAV